VIEIAPFAPSHSAGVVAMILPIQRSEFGISITLDGQPDLQNISGFYQQDAGNFWVALDNEKIVGTVALLDIGNRQAALRKMFVSAEYRGPKYGIAKQLLTTVIDWSHAREVQDIYLGTTAKFLAAHRFYEKNGFVEVARADLPPSFPVMVVDTKFYRRAT